MRARARRLCAACTACLLMAWDGADAHAATPAALRALDDAQQQVALDRVPRRIVSLSPGITEILFEIGAGERVVGVSDYSDTPPAARRLPRVAGAQGIDLEAIAQLRPDLIVVWGNGYPPARRSTLRSLAVPIFIYEPRDLDGVADSLERLGELVAAPAAHETARAYLSRLNELRRRYDRAPHPRVFYQIWSQPLMTLTGRHLASRVIELCGARNVFAGLAPLVATVDAEAVLAERPDLIVGSEPGAVDRGALARWRRFRQIPAVAHDRLVTLDADAMDRESTRVLDAAEQLCRAVDAARADLRE